jgi:hypothetical protein
MRSVLDLQDGHPDLSGEMGAIAGGGRLFGGDRCQSGPALAANLLPTRALAAMIHEEARSRAAHTGIDRPADRPWPAHSLSLAFVPI